MLRSSFYGFGTALSGLRVSQQALEVLGQNVSNANTEGYTRQRVDQVSRVSSTTAEKYGTTNAPITGNGAIINSLSQIRDQTLDNRFRTESTSLGRYDAEIGALKDIEAIFDEATTSGLRDAILDFEDSFQSFSQNPGSDESNSLTRSTASSLAQSINQYASQLRDSFNAELYDFEHGSVEDANSILKDLSTVNRNITNSEVAGDNPLELYDQRNTLLDRLSSYFDMEYSYEKIQLSSNVSTNKLHVYLKNETGVNMEVISGDQFAQFGVEVYDEQTGYYAQTSEERDAVDPRYCTVELRLTGLTSDSMATYETMKQALTDKGVAWEDYTPKDPSKRGFYDLTPITSAGKMDGDSDSCINAERGDNPSAVTNGIFFGTLNMLNGAGDFETGGSTIRGYQYYMKSLDKLANELGNQMNEQNQSYIYNNKKIEETDQYTGESYTIPEGAVLKAQRDASDNIMYTADGHPIYSVEDTKGNIHYGTIGESPTANTNYEFTEFMPNYTFAEGSTFTPDAGTTYNKISMTEKGTGNELFRVMTSGGAQATNDDGEYIYAKENGTDTDGNPIYTYGTLSRDTYDIEDIYDITEYEVDGEKKIDYKTGKDILRVTDESGNAVQDADGNDLFAIDDGYDAEGNKVYKYGTIADAPNIYSKKEDVTLSKLQRDNAFYKPFINNTDPVTGEEGAQETITIINDDGTEETFDLFEVTDYQGNQLPDPITGEPIYAIKTAGGLYKFMTLDKTNEAQPNQVLFTESEDITSPGRLSSAVAEIKNDLFAELDGVTTDNIDAKNISLTNKWLQGETKVLNSVKFAADATDNSADTSNLIQFINRFSNSTEFTTLENGQGIVLYTGGFEDYLSSVGDTSALDLSNRTVSYDSYEAVVNSIDNNRMSVSGVNLDEEAVDIYRFQRAYQASAKVITTLDEMLNTLINATA